MVILRHKICDFCGAAVGFNNRYYTIKVKNTRWWQGLTFNENEKVHICDDCMNDIKYYIRNKRQEDTIK